MPFAGNASPTVTGQLHQSPCSRARCTASGETASFSSLWGLYHLLSASDPGSQAHPGALGLSQLCRELRCLTLPKLLKAAPSPARWWFNPEPETQTPGHGPFFPEDHGHSSALQWVDKYYPHHIAEHPERLTLLLYSLGSLGKAREGHQLVLANTDHSHPAIKGRTVQVNML